MSEYTKPKVLELINNNKYLLTKLNKFKHLNESSSEHEFLNSMKIKIEDLKKIYNEYKQYNKIIIFDIDTLTLSLKEPNKDLPASLRLGLNFTLSFFCIELSVVVTPLVSIFNVSKVKKSEKGAVVKTLLSFWGITLSIAKVSPAMLPVVFWLPTNPSLKVSAPDAAWFGILYLTGAIIR